MDASKLKLLNDINRAIIQFRGIYSEWSARHGISYNEMLVLYTLRENGYCTQKQICDSYLLPKQTIHNVITALRSEGILQCDLKNRHGREKVLLLTPKGEEYAAPLLESLGEVEAKALQLLGEEKLENLTSLLLEYNAALSCALEKSR